MFKYLFIIYIFVNSTYALAPGRYDPEKVNQAVLITNLLNNRDFINACKDLTNAFENISEGIHEPENFKHLLTPNNVDQSFNGWLRHLFLDSIQFFNLFAENMVDILYESPEEISSFSDDINDKLNNAYIDLKLIWDILISTERLTPYVEKFGNPAGEKLDIPRSALMLYYATAVLRISPRQKENAFRLHYNILEIQKALDRIFTFVDVKDDKYYIAEHEAEKAV